VVFKGAGFPTVPSPFPPADSDLAFLRGWMVEGRKTRTLHKNREGCGTRILGVHEFAGRSGGFGVPMKNQEPAGRRRYQNHCIEALQLQGN